MARREKAESSSAAIVAPGMRVPPHSLEAERAVLGGVLLENQVLATVLEIVTEHDFYSQANSQIYEAMKGILKGSQPIDQITLRESLAQSGKLALVGGDEYLLSLTDTLPT